MIFSNQEIYFRSGLLQVARGHTQVKPATSRLPPGDTNALADSRWHPVRSHAEIDGRRHARAEFQLYGNQANEITPGVAEMWAPGL